MIVSNFARIDRSDRDRYHLCLEETRRRGCWRGKTGSIFQLFARSVFKFPPTWEGKSDSEPRELRLFDRWCVTRRGTRSFPPDSHFVVQTRIQGMPLLGSRFNRVERRIDAARGTRCRSRIATWVRLSMKHTFKRVFLREKMAGLPWIWWNFHSIKHFAKKYYV